MKQLLSFFIVIVLLASCKTENLAVQSKQTTRYQNVVMDCAFMYDSNYQYHIYKDDKISMSMWNHDELSVGSLFGIYNSNEVYGKWVMVDAEGNITLPMIGKFHILGMTVIQAKDTLTSRYSKWVLSPVIELKVLNKEITMLGELTNPGKYIVEKDNNSLFDMIARAGDFQLYANKKSIKIIRQQGEMVKMINVDITHADNFLSRNIQLQPGDVVVVPSKNCKDFEKRISAIIPIATSATAATILISAIPKL